MHSIYDMTLLSFLIAFGHFASEILIFRTAKIPGPVLSTVIVSSASLLSDFPSVSLLTCAFYTITRSTESHARALPLCPISPFPLLDDSALRILCQGLKYLNTSRNIWCIYHTSRIEYVVGC
jgi:hypothetical protein